MIAGAGRYVLNDVIARDLCIESVEEFIQHIARRMYDIADHGSHEFLRNIAPMHENRRAADPSQENSSRRLPQPDGKTWPDKSIRDGTPNGPPQRDHYPPGPDGAVSSTRRRLGMRQE
ncbi:hypothetical protein EVAR_84229_1 [Eumeta japonica]|uniref:Uncharacterized protein n=1 Tax=Eumeta variegata TaxID=151549 RepID=A0A4C1WQI4_EUMVA|nr:hypothetical protein EVAR_84229_1 [Eumeta japonica]